MALVTKRELCQLAHIHYITEIILALAYIILKSIPWVAIRVFETSEYSTRETELLIFTFILIAFKTRRRGHVNFLPYLSSACTMAKVGNFLLFFFANSMYGLTYACILVGHLLLFPKPKYKGPENIKYFLADDFERELARDKSVTWIIEFYESWNPDCNEFAGVFSELSAKFATKNLKFGKIDVSRSPRVAEKYNVTSSITSRTLPTLIRFKGGSEDFRRPLRDSRGRVVPFSFSYHRPIINNIFTTRPYILIYPNQPGKYCLCIRFALKLKECECVTV